MALILPLSSVREDMEKKVADLEKRMDAIENEIKILKSRNANHNSGDSNTNDPVFLDIPENMLEKIITLDESSQIPILWYYSNKPVMSVKEFLNVCAKKGFTLSSSWLPSAGGHFATTFITKQKIFHEVKGTAKSKEKFWKLTDIAKFKIAKKISEMNSK